MDRGSRGGVHSFGRALSRRGHIRHVRVEDKRSHELPEFTQRVTGQTGLPRPKTSNGRTGLVSFSCRWISRAYCSVPLAVNCGYRFVFLLLVCLEVEGSNMNQLTLSSNVGIMKYGLSRLLLLVWCSSHWYRCQHCCSVTVVVITTTTTTKCCDY